MAPEAESGHENKATAPIIKSTVTTFLDLPPACIEISPMDPRFFIIGTYFLDPEASKGQPGDSIAETQRSGSLILGLISRQSTDPPCADQDLQSLVPPRTNDDVGSSGSNAHLSVTLLETVPTPYAVLDLHFSPSKPSVLAVATSIGEVRFFRLDLMKECHPVEIRSIQIADPSILITSFAWKPSSSSARPIIAGSLSNGEIVIFATDSPGTTSRRVEAHSLEVWTVAWSELPDTEGAAVLYSGGDDSALCRHSEHLAPQNVQIGGDGRPGYPYEPLGRDMKTHSAGVTAILPIPLPSLNGQELLLTGSYDEYIRLLEPAVTGRRSKVLAEKRLGGGVWKLKLLRSDESFLGQGMSMSVLASCMHAGARVLEISRSTEGAWKIVVLARFEEHESMNYASDVCTRIDGDISSLIFVTTSFYDKKLCVWSMKDHG